MQAPKFSPGEPAIVQSKYSPEFNGTRVIVLRPVRFGAAEISGNMVWGYETMPPCRLGLWGEPALQPLPPKELAGCFDANEVLRKDEVSA